MPSPSSPRSRPPSDMGRYAGLGLTFASTMAVLGGLGWWLDSRFETRPWLLVTGILLGAVGGFVRIVKAVPKSIAFTPTNPPLEDDPVEVDPWKDRQSDPSDSDVPRSSKERAE